MKKHLLLVAVFVMFVVSCSTAHEDPYGRLYLPSAENIIKETNETKETNKIIKEPIKETKTLIEPKIEKEENLATLTDEEREYFEKLYNPNSKVELEKPVEQNPENYKDIQIRLGEEVISTGEKKEIKEEDAKIVEKKEIKVEIPKIEEKKEIKVEIPKPIDVAVETKVETEKKMPKYTREQYENIVLSPSDVKILKLIKKHYETLESYEIMELKTKEIIYAVRQQKDPTASTTSILKEIHEVIKELKTKSFVLAVDRVAKNKGLEK